MRLEDVLRNALQFDVLENSLQSLKYQIFQREFSTPYGGRKQRR